MVCTLKGRFSTYLPILSILKNTKNTQLYILGCKIGYLFCNLLIFSIYCGERGIRTPGASQLNGFQDRRNRPLCHLSGHKNSTVFPFRQISGAIISLQLSPEWHSDDNFPGRVSSFARKTLSLFYPTGNARRPARRLLREPRPASAAPPSDGQVNHPPPHRAKGVRLRSPGAAK